MQLTIQLSNDTVDHIARYLVDGYESRPGNASSVEDVLHMLVGRAALDRNLHTPAIEAAISAGYARWSKSQRRAGRLPKSKRTVV